jgi:hypothetical protein
MLQMLKNLFIKDVRIPSPLVHLDTKSNLGGIPPMFFDKALITTGSFEGAGTFKNVSGNFDGQGISAGILQWCLGQNSLQTKILRPYILRFGSIDNLDIFPVDCMDHLSKQKAKEAIGTAKRYMLSGTRLKRDWEEAWKEFMGSAEAIQIQKEAASALGSMAWQMCQSHGLLDIKSYCWFFDILTQNGSLKNVHKPEDTLGFDAILKQYGGKNFNVWKNLQADELSKTLFIWSVLRAKKANSRWMADVISRKGTIAMGRGTVHGKFYDLNLA